VTTAFALSGGGNLGPMQAGSMLALIEAGVVPDLIVGTSVGALNAAFLSTRPGVEGARTLVAAWSALQRREAVRLNPLTALAGFLGFHNHLVSHHQLRHLIRRWVQIVRLEEAQTPVAAVATDAVTGEAVVLTSGDTVDSLVASSAIPGLFPPVLIGGRWLVDGSLSANHPVLQAQDLGAHDTYLITTATAPRDRPARGAIAVAMNSVALLTTRADRDRLAQSVTRAQQVGGSVSVVPSAEPWAPSLFDFRRSAELADVAYRRTARWVEDGMSPET
jgi:NTE family protein